MMAELPRGVAHAALLGLTFLLTACGQPAGDPPSTDGSQEAANDQATSTERGSTDLDSTGTWRLQRGGLAGEPIRPVEEAPVELVTSGTEWAGNDGCNDFLLTLELQEERRVETITMSVDEAPCLIDGSEQVAQRFQDALLGIDTIEHSGQQLLLSGENAKLVFEER